MPQWTVPALRRALRDSSREVRVAAAEVANEVTAYLARNNLPAEAAMAPSPELDGYDWASQKMLALRRGAGRGSDQVSITGA